MSFFPTYRDNWTRTPNVFFDVILKDPKVTTNQVRLIGYLIRQTIGYNREAKWAAVSRRTLIKKAGIPNSRIKEAINGCEEKGWILTFEHGENGKQERYIFLNDPLNVSIVHGLEKGCFVVTDLEYLNLAGINKLIEKHNLLPTPTETGEVTPTETGEVTPTETGEVDTPLTQQSQGLAEPLNTSFKDNNNKDNNVKAVVAFYQEKFKEIFNTKLSTKDVKSFALEAEKNGKDLIDYIHYVSNQSEKKEIGNPVGYLREAVRGNYDVPSIAKLEQAAAKEEAKKAERAKEYTDTVTAALIAAGIDPKEVGY